MFSPELENLIQATLEDGVLEDYEKEALVKRAQAEGVDLTELEIYINSILQKRQRELEKEKNAKIEQHNREKKEAFGRVCPNCGKQVPHLTLKCECGYEFTSEKRVSSVEVLMEKINEIRGSQTAGQATEDRSNAGKLFDPMIIRGVFKSNPAIVESDRRVNELINMFPVPNTKEDIIDFLTLAVSNAKKKGGIMGTTSGRLKILVPIVLIIAVISAFFGEIGLVISLAVIFYGLLFVGLFSWKYDGDTLRWNKNAEVWRSKFDQVMLKGRSLRGDPDFQKQLDYYENLVSK